MQTLDSKSCAIIEGIDIDFAKSIHNINSPFMIVDLNSVEDAKKLVRRAILVRQITLHLADAPTLSELLEEVRGLPLEMTAPYEHVRFKFHVEGFNRSISMKEQIEIMERFAFMDCKGPVDLKNAETVFVYDEDWIEHTTDAPRRVYFGVHVGWSDRDAMHKYDLKKREYLGTTSMDPELSLVMANQGLVKKGSLVFDPFMGADIDGRQIRGKVAINASAKEDKLPPMRSAETRKQFKRDKELMIANSKRCIQDNIEQYGFQNIVLDTVVSDIACHPWRNCELWDAIPPYGIRAGARKIGLGESVVDAPDAPADYIKGNGDPKYPTTVAYEMDKVIVDLLAFAAKFLVKGGRLVYWLPTITDEYEPQDIPSHPSLRIISNCDQDFGKWSRRLVTMEKRMEGVDQADKIDSRTEPAHRHFRKKLDEINASLRKVVIE